MKLLILSGGVGSGLWPLSREDFPKQFLNVLEGRSLLELTLERFLPEFSPGDIFIITQQDQRFLVEREAGKFGISSDQLILEPVARGTAPAIYLGVRSLSERFRVGEEPVLVVSSDHYVREKDIFIQQVLNVLHCLDGERITLFGVPPREPYPDFGYIGVGEEVSNGCRLVKAFIEKPAVERARELINRGDHYWNTGIFAFFPSSFLRVWREHCSHLIADTVDLAQLVNNYSDLVSVSLDSALLEKAPDCLCYLFSGITWSDIGTFDHLSSLLPDSETTSLTVRTHESKNNLVLGQEGKLTALIGVENLTVVDTDDVLLLVRRGEGYRVKELTRSLKEDELPQIQHGLTSYRPWGYFKVLEEWPRFKIKRLVVYPGETLSLQLHHHRTEHWIVVSGTARTWVGNIERFVHEGENVFIPKSQSHRLENPGKVDLEVIEVQNGEYLGEDDITRLADKWGRE